MRGKKVNGRKRHMLVDTMGNLLRIVVHAADVQDRDGAKLVVAGTTEAFPRLTLIWADAAYRGALEGWVRATIGCTLEIVSKLANQVGFVVQPKRWIVERSFGWFGRHRRLSKDYELKVQTSEAFIDLATIRLMLKRLAPR